MGLPKKKKRFLETNLMKALLDPPDSDQRKNYVKRWIYGEVKTSAKKKPIGQRILDMIRR